MIAPTFGNSSNFNPPMTTAPVTARETRAICRWEKVSYGLGWAAVNLVLTIISTYLLYFYTDVAGLKASSVGFMFLVSRLLGSVAYLGVGPLIDQTSTRWGKSRPYLLWFAGPFAIMAVMTVLTPHFTGGGNLIYAYVTYNLLIIILSIVSLALGTILPSMTANLGERAELGAISTFFGIAALLTVSCTTLPLVRILGANDQAAGFRLTVGLYALLALALLLGTFQTARERIRPLRTGVIRAREQLSGLAKNVPWQLLMAAMAAFWVVVIMHTQTTVYYLRYSVHRPDLVPLVMATLAAALPGSLCTVAAGRRFGRRNAMLGGCGLAALGLVVIPLGGVGSVALLLIGNLIFSFGKGIIIALFMTMIADTVDYGEWRTMIRPSGALYAGITVSQNLGMGVGSAFSAWLLSNGRYLPNAVQTADSLRSIEWSYIWMPLIAVAIMIGILGFYRLDASLATIKGELEQWRNRREEGAQMAEGGS